MDMDIQVKVWDVEYGKNMTSEWLTAPSFRDALDKAELRIESWVVEGREDRAIELLSSKKLDEIEAAQPDARLWPFLTEDQRLKSDSETREMYAVSSIKLAGTTDA